MFYHASQTPGIDVLQPRVSNHHVPLIYFSKKRENVLVYLSNAIEKYCRETGFEHHGPWQKWGPYGFDQQGRLQFQEYYPNALVDTYQGVSGYIYGVETLEPCDFPLEIPDAAVSDIPVPVATCELFPMPWRPFCRRSGRGSFPSCAMSSCHQNFKPGTAGPSGRSTKTPRTTRNTAIFWRENFT